MKIKCALFLCLFLFLNACASMQQGENLSMPAAFIGEWTPNSTHAEGFKIFISADGHFDYRDSKNRPENKQYESYGTYKVIHITNDKDVYIMRRTDIPGLGWDYNYDRLHFEKNVFFGLVYIDLRKDGCHILRPTQEAWDTYSNDQHWQALKDTLIQDSPNPDYNENVPCEHGYTIIRYNNRH